MLSEVELVMAQLEYYTCVEGTEKNYEHLIQDNRFQDEDMNQGPCRTGAHLATMSGKLGSVPYRSGDMYLITAAFRPPLGLTQPPSLSLEAKEHGHIPDLSPLSTAKVWNAQSLVHTPSMLFHGTVHKHGSNFSRQTDRQTGSEFIQLLIAVKIHTVVCVKLGDIHTTSV
jgi:hypothetical protein